MASLVARAGRRLNATEAEPENATARPKAAEGVKRTAFSDITNQLGNAGATGKDSKAKLDTGVRKTSAITIPAAPASLPVAPSISSTTSLAPSTSTEWHSTLPTLDQPDAGNPQAVAEYASDIFNYLREREAVLRVKEDYMQSQTDVTEKMRMILVDWLVEVHWKFKLSPDTLFLTVHLLDRYLSLVSVKRTRLQLVGVTCMLIAAKHEEIYPPEIKDFVHVTDKAYTRQEILDMEVQALNTLSFQITAPSPLAHLNRMVKIQDCTPEHVALAQYLLELTLCNYRSIRHAPSHAAAAALFLANKILKIQPAWSPALAAETKYSEAQIKNCAKEMCALLQAAEKASLQAVLKKFSQSQFHRVAKMVA